MDYPSGSSYPLDPSCMHQRYLYEQHGDACYEARGVTNDQVPGASDFISDFHHPLSLAPTLATSSSSGSYATAPAIHYAPMDVKGMVMATPHTHPQTIEPPPPEDGSPVYLHPPNYGGFVESGYWNSLQTYPSFGGEDWLSFESSYATPLPSSIALPTPDVTGPMQSDAWNFEPPAAHMQVASMSVHDVHLSASGSSESSPSSRAVICQWGQRCGVPLDDLTAAGIARHLKEFHVQHWDSRSRGRCEWHGSPCTNSTMYYASFGKHIASVHLGATARPCDKCGETFARADTLDRHMKLYCRLRGKERGRPSPISSLRNRRT